MDIPRLFTIRESGSRIYNPIRAEQLAHLGRALHLKPGTTALDLGSGSGEMLCTWARDHGLTGVGVDMSVTFTERARARAVELGVADLVSFVHDDATGYVATDPVDLAACVGATWIGGGVAGTVELLARSLKTPGLMLIGEPYWRRLPVEAEVIAGLEAVEGIKVTDFLCLPELLEQFGELGYGVVEMVNADQDSWDRYQAHQWFSLRSWLDENPDDELADEVRQILRAEPAAYARYTREYFGWGIFALRQF